MVEYEFWLTVVVGLLYHYRNIKYFNWRVSELDEPNWMSWLFLFSVLCTLAWMKIHIIRIKKGRPPILVNRLFGFFCTLILTNLIVNEFWLPMGFNIIRLNGRMVDTLRKHNFGKTHSGQSFMLWAKKDSLEHVRAVLAVMSFFLMLQFTNFWQGTYKALFHKNKSPYATRSLEKVLKQQGVVH